MTKCNFYVGTFFRDFSILQTLTLHICCVECWAELAHFSRKIQKTRNEKSKVQFRYAFTMILKIKCGKSSWMSLSMLWHAITSASSPKCAMLRMCGYFSAFETKINDNYFENWKRNESKTCVTHKSSTQRCQQLWKYFSCCLFLVMYTKSVRDRRCVVSVHFVIWNRHVFFRPKNNKNNNNKNWWTKKAVQEITQYKTRIAHTNT